MSTLLTVCKDQLSARVPVRIADVLGGGKQRNGWYKFDGGGG
ncbi:MAG: hypothetical protein AB8B64_19905 [Granulosicoccus sp.]